MKVTAIRDVGSEIIKAIDRKTIVAEIANLNKQLDYIIYAFISGIYDKEIAGEKIYALELKLRQIDRNSLTEKEQTKLRKLNYKKEDFILNNLTRY